MEARVTVVIQYRFRILSDVEIATGAADTVRIRPGQAAG